MAIVFDSDPIRIEDAIGPVDGSNTDFQTSMPFEPDSIFAFVQGVAQDVVEIGPTTVRLSVAPVVGLKVMLQYAKA